MMAMKVSHGEGEDLKRATLAESYREKGVKLMEGETVSLYNYN